MVQPLLSTPIQMAPVALLSGLMCVTLRGQKSMTVGLGFIHMTVQLPASYLELCRESLIFY